MSCSGPMSLADELERSRIHFFTGKGGVGKSTIVGAVALALAERGKRPLIVELGHRASLSAIFSATPIDYRPREVAPGVSAMNVELEPALREYVADHLRVPGLAGLVLASKPLRRFFEAAPAVAEIVTLKKLEKLERERSRGRVKHDPILVDLDATGHATMFFELPHVFAGIARSGPLAALLDSFSALLRDETKSRLHVVTVPSDLPVNETLEFCGAMRERGPLGVASILVNRTPPSPPDDSTSEDAAENALRARFAKRREVAERAVARLEAMGLPLVCLPEVPATHDAPTRLRTLSRCIEVSR
jgi:arsenite/tail-anchored protein-transporting ATPase